MDESLLDSNLADGDLLSDSSETEEYDLHNDETFGDDCVMEDDWEEVHEKLAEMEESHKFNGNSFHGQDSQESPKSKTLQDVGIPGSPSVIEHSGFVRVSNINKGQIGSPRSLNDSYQLPPLSGGPNLDSLFKLARANTPKSPAIKTVEQLEKELQDQAAVKDVRADRSTSPEVAAAIRRLSLSANKPATGPPVLNSWLTQLQQQQVKTNGTPVRNIIPIQPIQAPLTPIMRNALPGQVSIATPIPVPMVVTPHIFHSPIRPVHLGTNQNPSFPILAAPGSIPRTPTRFEPAILRPITPSSITPPKPSLQGQKLSHLFRMPLPSAPSPHVSGLSSPMMMKLQNPEPMNIGHGENNMIGDGSHPNSRKREYQRHMDAESDHDDRDPYAGLMTPQERHWIAQIQLMPLNTTKPFEDDYYFTMHQHKLAGSYSLRTAKKSVIAATKMPEVTIVRNSNYTPLQFENSLGKIQAGSVVAPRKLIDASSIHNKTPAEETSGLGEGLKVSTEVRSGGVSPSRKGLQDLPTPLVQKKSCQTLITIEQMFQQVLLLEEDSSPLFEGKKLNDRDELIRTLSNHLNADTERISHIMSVRKGRILALRLLPFISDNINFWKTFTSSLETLMKTDDDIFLQFLPFFRRDLQTTSMDEIISLVESALPVLAFLVVNKVGISILASLVNRGATLYGQAMVEEKTTWKSFLLSLAEALLTRDIKERPVVAVVKETFSLHLAETKLAKDKKDILLTAL
ncbi:unnamed protein product [Bemisia tabaci]|uniref:mRNA decay factor PAT1 domain-containing protein n=1 Tax=Bemisia tabaci TaxID=7038 RepID=A0A9P0A5L9_BEMTA|nr:unnamed protein product [Bemisia tabaci]